MLFTILGYAFQYGVPIAILLAIVGIRKGEGMWGNIVSTINVTFAALLAINYFEPLAKMMAGMWAGALYVVDYIVVWGIFIVTLLILEEISKRISRVKVQFPEQVELVGGPLAGLALFVVLIGGFYQLSLLAAPLPSDGNDSVFPTADAIGKSYGFLSTGNLAPFIDGKPFDFQKLVDDHTKRRIAIKVHGDDKKTLMYDGPVPGGS